jgi:cytochrome bd ubiquinol oxidase subunit I
MERSIPYLWMGAIVTSVVVVGGVSAWNILRREQPAFFARSFKVAASLLLVVAAVHILVTKSSGMTIWASEPLRVANGVSAWLLVLGVWTASSWRRTFKRVVNSASEGRLLLA